MFPNVRLLIAATIVSVVALSCGFAVFAALRVNHEPLARSAAPPLRLLASLSPSPPIMVAAVEPFDREARPSEPSGAVDLADASARTLPANDQVTAAPAAEPDAPPVAANDVTSSPSSPSSPPAPDADAERETEAPPASVATGASSPDPAQAPSIAAVPAPADQSVVIDEAGQETEFVPAALPRPAAKPAKAAAKSKRKTARAHAAAKTRHARRALPSAPSGVAGSTTQESPPAIGGPFVSPWAH
jgi:hypothetical protein